MTQFLSGAAGAALIGGAFGLITWILNRHAAKKDKEQDKDDEILSQIAKISESVTNLDVKIETLRADTKIWVSKVRTELEESKIVEIRARILRFGDEIQHGRVHSEEHYRQTLADIDCYERYCAEHKDFKNNTTVLTIKRIESEYQKHMSNNTFLV